jgi:two-component system response regulator PilR (NtrC family)
MARGHILVVDDDPDVLDVVRRALVAHGCRVSAARRVSVARDILMREPVDLVITDARIPGESGIQLASHVRDCGIAVIIMTGDPDWTAQHGLLPAPCLAKPFELHALWRIVAGYLDAGQPRADALLSRAGDAVDGNATPARRAPGDEAL